MNSSNIHFLFLFQNLVNDKKSGRVSAKHVHFDTHLIYIIAFKEICHLHSDNRNHDILVLLFFTKQSYRMLFPFLFSTLSYTIITTLLLLVVLHIKSGFFSFIGGFSLDCLDRFLCVFSMILVLLFHCFLSNDGTLYGTVNSFTATLIYRDV
jgi:hypothetical protein